MSRGVGTGEPAETMGSPKFLLLIVRKLWHFCMHMCLILTARQEKKTCDYEVVNTYVDF